MTILAAAVGVDCACVGGDGRSTDNGYIIRDNVKKWRQVDDLRIGHAGSSRGSQILDKILCNYVSPEMLCNIFKSALTDDGWRWSGSEGSRYCSERLMFVNREQILVMGSDFTLWRPEQSYWAVGSGEDFALGAMHAFGDKSPYRVVYEALSAACSFRSDCGGSWYIEAF